MDLKPKQKLTNEEVERGLRLIIIDGLAAEAMTTFTGGAFVIVMAVLLGASNAQIGIVAALPAFANMFQLLAVWIVKRVNNRRAVTFVCSVLARLPLVAIGLVVMLGIGSSLLKIFISLLFFYYFFGALAGPGWNAWMKDLVPEDQLGSYFARRSSYTQALNAGLSLALALAIDYVSNHYPVIQLKVYAVMFIAGGIIGLIGAFVLARADEPAAIMEKENIFRMLLKPLRDGNFFRLLIFHSGWTFALNLATPFFVVFMLNTVGLSLAAITVLTILSQVASILTIRVWGKYADSYSNKTIIAISAPLYILCLLAWCFVGLYQQAYFNLVLLFIIHIVTGISTAGINLSITNLGLKLAPKENAMVYLSARNLILALFGAMAPVAGGALADFFSQRSLTVNAAWATPEAVKSFPLIALHGWNFLFLAGALLAMVALEILVHVREVGEVEKELVVRIMRKSIRTSLKDFFTISTLISWHEQLWQIIKRRLTL